MNQSLSVNRGRLSVLVGLVILTFSLLPLIQAPSAGSVTTSFLGTPVQIELTGATIVLLLVTVLTCAGVDMLVRDHPLVRRGVVARTFPYWIIPGLTVVVASQLLNQVNSGGMWIMGLFITALLLAGVILAEYATIDPEGPFASRARLFLTAMAYVLAMLLFALIWNTRDRSILSAPLTFIFVAGLAFDLLYATQPAPRRVALLAVTIGLVLAEGNWAINYWRSNVFVAAIAQLLAFYALVVLAGQYLLDRINRRVLIEFAVVMAIAMFLLLREQL